MNAPHNKHLAAQNEGSDELSPHANRLLQTMQGHTLPLPLLVLFNQRQQNGAKPQRPIPEASVLAISPCPAPAGGKWTCECRASSSLRSLVNRVERAAVVEVSLLGLLPAAEDVIDREQFDLRKLRRIFLQDFG